MVIASAVLPMYQQLHQGLRGENLARGGHRGTCRPRACGSQLQASRDAPARLSQCILTCLSCIAQAAAALGAEVEGLAWGGARGACDGPTARSGQLQAPRDAPARVRREHEQRAVQGPRNNALLGRHAQRRDRAPRAVVPYHQLRKHPVGETIGCRALGAPDAAATDLR